MNLPYQIIIIVCFYCFNRQSNVTREQFIQNYNLYINECLKPDYLSSPSHSSSTSSHSTALPASLNRQQHQLSDTTSSIYSNLNINLNDCLTKNAQNVDLLNPQLFDNKLIDFIYTISYANNMTSGKSGGSMINELELDPEEYGAILNEVNYDYLNPLENNKIPKKPSNKKPQTYSNKNESNKISKDDNLSSFVNQATEVNQNKKIDNKDPLMSKYINQYSMIFLIILYTLTVILSICGNFLVIIVMCCGFRSSFLDIRIYLINLSVFNLLMSIFCIPFTFVNALLGKWIFNAFLCPLTNFIQLLSVNGCIGTLTVLAINRFLAVAYPLKYNSSKTNGQKRRDIIIVWIGSFVLSFIQLFIYKCVKASNTISSIGNSIKGHIDVNTSIALIRNISKTSESNSASISAYCICKEIWHSNESTSLKYYLFYTIWIFIETYFAPVVILIIMYSRIIYILWNRNFSKNSYLQENAANGRIDQTQYFKSRTYKTIRMLCVVIITFSINWLPIHLFHLYLAIVYYNNIEIKLSKRTMTVLFFLSHWLSMSNSFINPIIYSFMNQRFKADLRHLLYCIRPENIKRKKKKPNSVIQIRNNDLNLKGKENSDDSFDKMLNQNNSNNSKYVNNGRVIMKKTFNDNSKHLRGNNSNENKSFSNHSNQYQQHQHVAVASGGCIGGGGGIEKGAVVVSSSNSKSKSSKSNKKSNEENFM